MTPDFNSYLLRKIATLVKISDYHLMFAWLHPSCIHIEILTNLFIILPLIIFRVVYQYNIVLAFIPQALLDLFSPTLFIV